MALKDTWVDLEDAIEGVPDSGDVVSVEPINKIAHSVIALEKNGTGTPGKSPYIGDNGNWFEYDGAQYVDTGVKAQGEPGFPNVEIHENDGSGNSYQWENDFPALTEIRFGNPLNHFCVYGFLRNPESNGNDMWAVSFTAATDEEGYGPSVTLPNYVEWAVAEPVFTAGYTYYLSFIPLVDEGVDEYGCFKGKILGIWVAKELS